MTTSSVLNEIEARNLGVWFADHVVGLRQPLNFALLSAGRSNLTCLVIDADGRKAVLRRPPRGPLVAGAHDVMREWRIMSGVSRTAVPVPGLLAACEDPTLLGAPFFVMDHVPGVPLNHESAQAMTQQQKAHVLPALAENLAELHRTSLEEMGLGHLRRDVPFVMRQLKGFTRQLGKLAVESAPAVTHALEIAQRLERAAPAQRTEVLVHGDFKADNLMIDASGDVTAVLDWELAAAGDPLFDLAWLLVWWGADVQTGPWLAEPVAHAGGFPDPGVLVAEYAALTGFDVSNLDFFMAFAYWRLCALNLATRARFTSGAMPGKELDVDRLDQQIRWQLAAADTHLGKAAPRRVLY